MTAPVAAQTAAQAVQARRARKQQQRAPAASPAAAPPSGASGTPGGGGASGGAGTGRGRPVSAPSIGRPTLLLAEFVLCVVLVGLSPMTDKHKDDSAADWMARASAVCGLFFVLSLLAAGGPRSARVARGFGGLVTLTLMVSERSVFLAIARRLNPSGTGAQLGGATDAFTPPGGDVGASAGIGPDTPAARPGRSVPA